MIQTINSSIGDAGIIAALNARMGTTLSVQSYYDWLEGGDAYDVFDETVKKFLGQALYDNADARARLDGVFRAAALGKKRSTIGGAAFDLSSVNS